MGGQTGLSPGGRRTSSASILAVLRRNLGNNVANLASKSPTLLKTLVEAHRTYGNRLIIKKGHASGKSHNTITIKRNDPPLEQVLALAHELYHFLTLNIKAVPIRHLRSHQEAVRESVAQEIREEIGAIRAEVTVRKEMRRAGVSVYPMILKIPRVFNGVQLTISVNIEPFIHNDVKMFECVRKAPSEVNPAESNEVFWSSHYRRHYRIRYRWQQARPSRSR